jgi:hypothetical protein
LAQKFSLVLLWATMIVQDGITIPLITDLEASEETFFHRSGHFRSYFQQNPIYDSFGYKVLLSTSRLGCH